MSDDDIIDAEWEDVPDDDVSREPVRNIHRTTPRPLKPSPSPSPSPSLAENGAWPNRIETFWHETAAPFLSGAAHLAVIIGGGTVLISLALAWFTRTDVPAAVHTSEPSTERVTAQHEAQQDAEQMLRTWTKTVTGQADASGFAMVNGSGKPGDFCNNSNGDTVLKFGGETTGYDTSITIFDFFAEFHGETGSGVIGAFWYDPSDGGLLTRNQAVDSADGEHGKSVPDIVHAIEAAGDGTAKIDGTTYHVCTM